MLPTLGCGYAVWQNSGVKAWDELTERGRLRRAKGVAVAALEQYPVEVLGLRLIGGFTNALYRVDTPDGPLAVRVDLMQEHADSDAEIELGWLEELAADRLVNVSAPIRTIDDRLYTHASAPGVPGPRRCTLLTWVPGRALADRVEPRHFETYGAMSARLHQHGARHRPPHRPMPWDRVFYYPEEVDPVVWNRPENVALLPAGGVPVVEEAIEIIHAAFDAIPDADRQLVHGDLHLWNVHVRRNELWALDFEDIMWATPGQDIAITLYYVDDGPERAGLIDAFRQGYETVAPWPTNDVELDVFMAARRTMFVNFVFNIDLPDRSGFLERAIPKLEAFVSRHG